MAWLRLLTCYAFLLPAVNAFQGSVAVVGNTNATIFFGGYYLQHLSGPGCNGGCVFSIASGDPPPGISLSASGVISGTPSVEGDYSFQVRVQHTSGSSASQSFRLLVAAPYASYSVPSATSGVFYSFNLLLNGLTLPYPLQIISGNLPPGLTLSSSGVLSGTPTGSMATYNFALRNPQSATTLSLSLFVSGTVSSSFPFASVPMPAGAIGFSYNHQFVASGGLAPYNFTLFQGAIPPGLTLSPSGQLFGTPSANGVYSFSIRVTDSQSNTATAPFTITVAAGALQLPGGILPNATAGSNYSYDFRASGGQQPITYSFAVLESLPIFGFNLSPSGRLSGIPNTAGTFGVSIVATDASGISVSSRFTLVVQRPNFIITNTSLPIARLNERFEFSLASQGGTPPIRFQTDSGFWPPGISINSNGTIMGTPTSTGDFWITIKATDSLNFDALGTVNLKVEAARLAITNTSLPNATATQAYSHTLTVSGGQAPYRFTIVSGALPAGLTLTNLRGVLEGVPTAQGNYPFTVRVTDSRGETADRALLLTVAAAPEPLSLTPTLAPASLYATYSATLSGRGGRAPYTYNLSGGTLPPGLNLALNGVMSGAPTTPGTYRFSARVMDSANASVQTELTLNILPATILPLAIVNRDYSAPLPIPGPHSPLPTSFPLPAGLSVNGGNSLQGRPFTPGIYGFSLTNASTGLPTPFLLYVAEEDSAASPNRIRTASLPPATLGLLYDQSLLSDAPSPRLFALASGALPAGLTLDPNSGALRGIPAAEGIHPFTLRVSTPNGLQSAHAFLLQVSKATGPSIPRIHAVTSAASYESGGVAPGELLTFFGDALGPQTLSAAPVTRVAFDNQTAPLIYTQANQVSAIAPFALQGRALTRLTIEYQGLTSAEFLLPILAAKPAVFAIDGSGQGPGAILNQDASVNSAANRAAPESVVVLYATGGGSMTPEGIDGVLATGTSTLKLPVRVEVAGRQAQVLYAGNAPGLLHGVIQINVKLPPSLPPGLQPLRLEVGGRPSLPGISVWLR